MAPGRVVSSIHSQESSELLLGFKSSSSLNTLLLPSDHQTELRRQQDTVSHCGQNIMVLTQINNSWLVHLGHGGTKCQGKLNGRPCRNGASPLPQPRTSREDDLTSKNLPRHVVLPRGLLCLDCQGQIEHEREWLNAIRSPQTLGHTGSTMYREHDKWLRQQFNELVGK